MTVKLFQNRVCLTHFMAVAWFAAALLPCAGCGGDSGGRLAAEGTVTFNGEPVSKGSIAFRPMGSTESPSSGSEIVNGHFSIPGDKGLMPGEFRVEIQAVRKTGKTVDDPLFGPTDVEEQYLPTRYNKQSELTAEIVPGQSNELNFELKSE